MLNSTILVTGGTGSFGKTFVERILGTNPKQVIIFSRDEEKQHRMRLEYPMLRYEIGDVRDEQRVREVTKNVDYIFHAAALKQVPSCEFFPLEAVKTNILGATNVIKYAIENNVKKVVCLSTDKAVYPINAMGMSKALMEKIAISSNTKGQTVVCVTRYGNVMCSRGSVIPMWIEAAKSNQPITVTDPDMTRFLLSLDDAIDLVLYAIEHGSKGDTFVKKAPACTMLDLAIAVRELLNSKSEIKHIGIRHGEKKHESLISEEEMYRTASLSGYYKVYPDNRDLNYDKFFTKGQDNQTVSAYTSLNTKKLNVADIKHLLKGLKEFQ